jgi:phosphoribosylformylglycinamidine synthase
MAGRAGSGIEIDVAKVPRREEGMTPYEVMLSESQERMLIVAKRGREDEVLRIFHKWDLDAAVIGRVTDDGRVRILDSGREVANLPVSPLTDGAPVYDRPTRRPGEQDALQAFDPLSVPPGRDHGETLLALLARPTIASKEWLIRQYDHTVRLGAVVRPGPADAAVVRVERTKKGLALAVDCNARFVYLDPFEGARLAVAECARNVSCVGGEPLGLTDCLNFGNPERPEIMWQFAEATRGISAACRELGVPVVSGNVSLYNETEGRAILPTPTVAVVGLLPDVSATCTGVFRRAGDRVAILGETRGQLGGSEWLLMTAGKIAGRPPTLDAARRRRSSPWSVSWSGARRSPPRTTRARWARGGARRVLHGERGGADRRPGHASRWLGGAARVPLRGGRLTGHRLLRARARGGHRGGLQGSRRSVAPIGTVGGDRLIISGLLDVPVARLSDAWRSGIPALMKKPTHL